MKLKDKKTLNEIINMGYEFIGYAGYSKGTYAVFGKENENIYMAKYDKNTYICMRRYVAGKEGEEWKN